MDCSQLKPYFIIDKKNQCMDKKLANEFKKVPFETKQHKISYIENA